MERVRDEQQHSLGAGAAKRGSTGTLLDLKREMKLPCALPCAAGAIGAAPAAGAGAGALFEWCFFQRQVLPSGRLTAILLEKNWYYN
jgi:hypothetical protein